MTLLPTDNDRIVMTGEFPGFSKEELFDHFTKEELITQWWPQSAEIEPRVDGRYWLFWPSMSWTLRGTILEYVPGERLRVDWQWDHGYPVTLPQSVLIGFGETEGGARILLEHGPFEAEDEEGRRGIIDGWLHFGDKLQKLPG